MSESNQVQVKESKSEATPIDSLYQCIVDMLETSTVDTYNYFNYVKKSLKYNFKSTALILFYIADERGLNKPEWIVPVIQYIAEEKNIYTSKRISFYKGLTRLNDLKNIFFYDENISVAKKVKNEIINKIGGFDESYQWKI